MKIIVDVEGQSLSATLYEDRSAAADFAALLPLQLTLSDYGSVEKISNLPEALSTQGEPNGCAAKAGDITYYAPWGNLAIFLKDFRHAAGLVQMGCFDGDISALRRSGPIEVTLRRADND